MDNIYRVIDIDKDGVNSVFVFHKEDGEIDYKRRLSTSQYQTYKKQIGEKNYDSLQDTTKVFMINENIFNDDSIDTIKRKIIKAKESEVSFDELYLFSMREEVMNNFDMFEVLTQNDNLEIEQVRLFQFIQNFLDIDIDTIDLDKEIYSYEDIIQLNLDNKTKIKKFSLDNKYFIEKIYPLVINPFDLVQFDSFLLRQGDDIVSTKNKSLLLDNKQIYENNIYLCCANNVFEYLRMNELSFETAIKLYYPYLYEKNITSYENYIEKRDGLLAKNKQILSKTFERNNNNIQLLRDIYKEKKSELNYINNGINEVSFIMNPRFNIVMPLEIVFKILNTSETVPFIKYNPGKGREKVYRLYADKISTNGKKIPLLSKASITKLKNNMAKDKEVELYINDKESKASIFISFNEQGQISCRIELEELKQIDEINIIVRENVNKIIDVLQEFLEQRGYTFDNFTTLYHENITINKINYQSHIEITRNIKLKKYNGCLSSVVNIVNDNLKEGIIMKYKRVSYFNKMESMEALITELALQNKSSGEIVRDLEDNFKMTNEEASEKYSEWLSNIQVEQQIYQNRKLKIKSNPGFNITITKDKFVNKINVNVDNINNLGYLTVIPVYIDSILRLTQDMSSTKVKREQINKLCSGKEIVEKTDIIDFESKIVEDLQKNTGFEFVGDKLEEQEMSDDDGLLGMLEDEDEEEDIMEGGGETDSDEDDLLELEEATPEEEEFEFELEEATPSETSKKSKSKSASPEADAEEFELEEATPSETSKKSKSKSATSPEADAEEFELEEATPSETSKKGKSKSVSPEADAEEFELEEATPSETSKKSKSKSASPEADAEEFELEELSEGSQLTTERSRKTISKTKSKTEKEEEEDDDEEIDAMLQDIDGMSLTNPNPFFEKMKKKDPALFLTKKDGKFKAYSRICPSNLRRQPVILTDKEMKYINKHHRSSYDKALKYGSDKDNQYWYICPRYWCLKTNTSISEEDVKAGKCGKIIPRNAKTVPKDAYVYEFSADAEHKDDDTGEYIVHNPGFQKTTAHPDGLCIPCCFKNWDSPAQKERRAICAGKKDKSIATSDKDEYIKGIDKFPLNKNRWGELPLSIQKLLHTDNSKCFEEGSKKIKKFTRCMLRKGIEVNKEQSFVGVLSDIIPDLNKELVKTTPTIKEMKQLIINALDLDNFLTFFNGSLAGLFSNDSLSVNITKYNKTKLYNQLDLDNKNIRDYFKGICSSFENFIDYLSDDDIVIDHTFLWDIVSKKNEKLFPTGLNLAILEIPDNDITDNVEIVCPTNQYSNEIYSSKKPTVIIMKKDSFYEPIYIYRDEEDRISVTRFFSPYNSHLMSNIKHMLHIIKMSQIKCMPKDSKPRVYTFKRNKEIYEIKKLLKKTDYKIEKQVLNYNNKVVGLMIRNDVDSGFIPVEPSSLIETFEYTYIDDDIWLDMEDTYTFLMDVYKASKYSIPVKPIIKVIDDEKVVGFLTETNQFVQFDTPQDNILFTDMDQVDGLNYYVSDKDTLLNTNVDKERIQAVKNIKLETNFYNAFRNNARILLNTFENVGKRKKIEDILNDLSLQYSKKIELIVTELKNMMNDKILFNDDLNKNKELLMTFTTITGCLDKKCREKQYCYSSGEDDNCKLIIPGKHLLSGNDNEEIYYYRLSDELVRYGLVRNFMMKPKVYLSVDKLDYNLGNNEIILLDTILTTGYFDDLVEMKQNKYTTHTIGEFIQPLHTQVYNNQYTEKTLLEADKREKRKKVDVCVQSIVKIKGVWGKRFKEDYYQKQYFDSPTCSFTMILDIINDYTNKNLSIMDVKKVLIREINNLIETYGKIKVLRYILKDQGKELLTRQVLEDKINIEQMILSTNYYITNLDIIILGMHYKAPIVLLSGTKLLELVRWKLGGLKAILETKENRTDKSKATKKMWIVNNTQKPEFYYFIKQPGISRNKIPKYSILSKKDSIRTYVSDLTRKLISNIAIYKKRPSFEDYIKEYKPIIVVQKKTTGGIKQGIKKSKKKIILK